MNSYDKELSELEKGINSDLQAAALFGIAGGNHSFSASDFFRKLDRLVVIRIKQHAQLKPDQLKDKGEKDG